MANVTVTAFPIPDWHWGGTTAKLRLYASIAWTDSVFTPHIKGTIGSKTGFYQEVPLTVSGTTVTVPEFVTQSTDDAYVNPGVTITGVLFDSKNTRRETLFSQWVIPVSSPTDWGDLITYNQGQTLVNPSIDYLNRVETNALIDAKLSGAGFPVDATYITQTPNATLINEQALSLLATGPVKNTMGTGVLSVSPINLASGVEVTGNLAVTHLNSGTNASDTTFWRGDGSWQITPYPSPAKNYVINFGAGGAMEVYNLYPAGTYGPCFWEIWLRPDAGNQTCYFFSAGYGGSHVLLFGFSGTGPYTLTGNMYDGSGNTTFGADEGPNIGEWCHLAVGWDGTQIITYMNGMPIGYKAFAGPRVSSGAPVENSLWIGGSDHQNFTGAISQVRGFEGRNPLQLEPVYQPAGVFAFFSPQFTFSKTFAGQGTNCSVWYNFLQPTAYPIPDLSGNDRHGGVRGTTGGVIGLQTFPGSPISTTDATAPWYDTQITPSAPATGTPPAAPTNALIFDSFTRPHSIPYLASGTPYTNPRMMQSTESGSLGPKLWNNLAGGGGTFPAYAIFNGRAVMWTNGGPVITYVAVGQTDVDIRVDRRHPSSWNNGINTSIAFRVQDYTNYCYVIALGGAADGSGATATVGYKIANVNTTLASGIALPAAWTTLRVVTKADGTITCYADATQFYNTPNAQFASQTGAGLFTSTFNQQLALRWDNFTVYAAP